MKHPRSHFVPSRRPAAGPPDVSGKRKPETGKQLFPGALELTSMDAIEQLAAQGPSQKIQPSREEPSLVSLLRISHISNAGEPTIRPP
ncbi:hypothetical protein ABW21_db0207290 [Orbilia brochopaga]|nr:hypothetical protein ABW21_db0207290 [Drechslerella brochopaga]